MVIDRSGEALDKDNVVIEILEDAIPGDELLQAVKEMHAHGYCFALDDFTLAPEWDAFLPYISVLKFDVQNNTFEQIENYLQSRKSLTGHIKYLAEKVETKAEFIVYRDAGFTLFQGYFFCRPEVIKYKRLSQNQLAIFRLQMEAGRNKPDFRIIESLIKTDLTLSYKIMRYMKHTAYKYGGNLNLSKLSLSEVLMYLGENQIRRFVAVVVLASAGNDTVNELYPLSMMRGRFCELIAENRRADSGGKCLHVRPVLVTRYDPRITDGRPYEANCCAAERKQCAVPSGGGVSRHCCPVQLL